ncbi:unnamed protein product [Sphagnum tenellum]
MPYTTEGDNHNRHITTPILVKSNPAYYRQTFLLSRDGLPLTRMAILTSFQGLVIVFTRAGNKMNRIDTMYHLKFMGRLRGSIINETYRIEVLSQLSIALSPTRPRPIITTEHEVGSAEITRACALNILAGPHMVVAPAHSPPMNQPDCRQQQVTTKKGRSHITTNKRDHHDTQRSNSCAISMKMWDGERHSTSPRHCFTCVTTPQQDQYHTHRYEMRLTIAHSSTIQRTNHYSHMT